jgi:hypothetical protein
VYIPIAKSEVSVSNRRGSLLWNITRTGGLMYTYLSVLNALSYFLVYLKAFFFFVRSVSGIAIFKKF